MTLRSFCSRFCDPAEADSGYEENEEFEEKVEWKVIEIMERGGMETEVGANADRQD